VFGVGCDGEMLSGDELFTIYFSQWKVRDLVPILFEHNNIPPTFEYLLHHWLQAFSTDAFVLRMLPVIFSAATVPAIFLIGKKMGGNFIGGWAAFFFLLCPFQMEWAHLLRSYSMMIMGASWSMYFFISFLENKKNNALAGWIFFSFIAASAHYLSWLVIFTQGIAWLAIPGLFKKEDLKKVVLSFLILLALSSPILFYLIKRLLLTASEGTYIQPTEHLGEVFRELFKMVSPSVYMLRLLILFATWALLTSIFSYTFGLKKKLVFVLFTISCFTAISWGFTMENENVKAFLQNKIILYVFFIWTWATLWVWIRKSNDSWASKIIVLWLVVPFSIMFFASFKIPMFVDRYLSFISPSIILLIPLIFRGLPRPAYSFTIASAAIIALINFQFYVDRPTHPDQIMAQFKKFKKMDTPAIWAPGYCDLIWSYYYNREIFENAQWQAADTLGTRIVREEGYTVHKEGIRRQLRNEGIFIANDTSLLDLDLSMCSELVFVDGHSEYVYPNNGLRAKIEKEFGPPVEEHTFDGNARVSRYARANSRFSILDSQFSILDSKFETCNAIK